MGSKILIFIYYFVDNEDLFSENENIIVSKLVTGETASFAHIASKGHCGPNCGKKSAGILTDIVRLFEHLIILTDYRFSQNGQPWSRLLSS